MGRWAVAVRRRMRRIATDRPATDVTVLVLGVIPNSFCAPRIPCTHAEPERHLLVSVRATGGADWARPVWCASTDAQDSDASRASPSNAPAPEILMEPSERAAINASC